MILNHNFVIESEHREYAVTIIIQWGEFQKRYVRYIHVLEYCTQNRDHSQISTCKIMENNSLCKNRTTNFSFVINEF